jgi:hypothetical protein
METVPATVLEGMTHVNFFELINLTRLQAFVPIKTEEPFVNPRPTIEREPPPLRADESGATEVITTFVAYVSRALALN